MGSWPGKIRRMFCSTSSTFTCRSKQQAPTHALHACLTLAKHPRMPYTCQAPTHVLHLPTVAFVQGMTRHLGHLNIGSKSGRAWPPVTRRTRARACVCVCVCACVRVCVCVCVCMHVIPQKNRMGGLGPLIHIVHILQYRWRSSPLSEKMYAWHTHMHTHTSLLTHANTHTHAHTHTHTHIHIPAHAPPALVQHSCSKGLQVPTPSWLKMSRQGGRAGGRS